MKRLKVLSVLYVLLGSWHCGGDGSSSSGPNSIQNVGPPEPPGQLRVDKIGDGEVWLNWQAAGEEGDVLYIVYRSVADSGAVAVDSTFRISFQDRGLEYDLEYTYYVTALNTAGGESTASNLVSGQPFNNLAPLAPTSVRAVAHHSEILDKLDIILDWDENRETDLVGYRVYRSTEEAFTADKSLLRSEVTVARFVDEEISVGTVYYYLITAVDRGGKESAVSEQVTDVPLPLAQLVTPVTGELTSPQPIFVWHALTEALSYRVVVTTDPGSGEISDMPLTADTTAVFMGRVQNGNAIKLVSGEEYWWKVVASTKEGGVENSVSKVESFKIR